MPDAALTEMDLAVLTCLLSLNADTGSGVQPGDLQPCLQAEFPGYDRTSMREGESLTRLRGRQLIDIHEGGAIVLTITGKQMAEGLALQDDETR